MDYWIIYSFIHLISGVNTIMDTRLFPEVLMVFCSLMVRVPCVPIGKDCLLCFVVPCHFVLQ